MYINCEHKNVRSDLILDFLIKVGRISMLSINQRQ